MAFHWKDGWYFERLTMLARYRWVRIYHVDPEQQIADVDIEIDPDSWASIMASVSRLGETAYTFALAKALHGGP